MNVLQSLLLCRSEKVHVTDTNRIEFLDIRESGGMSHVIFGHLEQMYGSCYLVFVTLGNTLLEVLVLQRGNVFLKVK